MKRVNLKQLGMATIMLAVALFSTSCEKDEPKVKESAEVKEVSQKFIKDYGKWYYFSFEKGDFVGEDSAIPEDGDDAKWAKRTDWDIAFHRQNVRTNGGTSGVGKGAVLALETEDFESVKEFNETNFILDAVKDKGIITDLSGMMSGNIGYSTSSINEVANKWVAMKGMGNWFIAKKNVFIIKAANGKYAKLQFVNFLNDKDLSGYITFKYAYQKDGSTKFE